jgi:hypothetical protein
MREPTDEADQHVVRAGLARPANLIAGTTMHRMFPELTGFSVQSAPGISIEELARGGQFRNRQISVTTVGTLRRHGFETAFPTPGRGAYHATVRVPDPLPPDIAALLSSLFVQCPNPHPVP